MDDSMFGFESWYAMDDPDFMGGLERLKAELARVPTPNRSGFSVMIEERARDAIRAELAQHRDDHECSGPLAGRIDGHCVMVGTTDDLVGDWRVRRESSRASLGDVARWDTARRVNELPVYVGLIVRPELVTVLGVEWMYLDAAAYVTTADGSYAITEPTA
jgi:hypothetical protein